MWLLARLAKQHFPHSTSLDCQVESDLISILEKNMIDPRLEKLADMIVNYSLAVKPGQKIFIRSVTTAEPLINEIFGKILEAGGYPYLFLKFPGTDEIFMKKGSEDQIQTISDVGQFLVNHYDAMIMIKGELNTHALSGIDPKRLMLERKAEGPLMQRFFERLGKGEMTWVSLIYPTHAYAQDADMSLGEYEDFAYQAYMPDFSDPIGYWKKIEEKQDRIIDWLEGKKDVHLIAEGTDLKLKIEGRRWMNACCKNNIPDGEIYTGPVENSAEGVIQFTYPAVWLGNEVVNVKLWFEKGKVVKAEADKNEKFLLKILDTDEGARFIGEFAIGTNFGINRFTKQILFDEKIGGSIHLALGNGYPMTGSTNQSAIHWDMICDLKKGGEIRIDDELLFKDGSFQIKIE